MIRNFTSLPHKELPFGEQWDGSKGNYSPENFRGTVDTIILHTTVGSLPGTAAWFDNPASKVSANYGIYEETIYSFVPEKYVSFHAGDWKVNQRSIGIEHVDNGNPQGPRSDVLYETSAKLVADICKFYNIPIERSRIKPHNEISKTACPGNLDINRIIRLAKELSEQSPMRTYQMPEKVFLAMVTEGTNYKELLKGLGISPELSSQANSHLFVLDHIDKLVKNNPFVEQEDALPTSVPVEEMPTNQSKSIWKTDVLVALKDILGILRGGKR